MRTHHLFWGILFVTLGVLVLLNNFAVLDFNWDFLWNLWPLILIVLGAFFIFRDVKYRWVFVLIMAFLLGLVIFAGFKSLDFFYHGDFEDFNIQTQEFREPYNDSIRKAKLSVETAMGTIDLKGVSNDLIEARAKGGYGTYSMDNQTTNEMADIRFELEHGHREFHGIHKQYIDMKLNPNPLWDLDFNVGAASVDLDLGDFKTENIFMKSGAASIKLKLGDKSERTNVKFESGASSLNIMVPKDCGCEINTDIHLSDKHFDEFVKVDNNVYRTADFDKAAKKVYLDINAGISSIKVDRY